MHVDGERVLEPQLHRRTRGTELDGKLLYSLSIHPYGAYLTLYSYRLPKSHQLWKGNHASNAYLPFRTVSDSVFGLTFIQDA